MGDRDTRAMTVSVPAAKLLALRETLTQWPAERTVASEKELRGLIGRLLNLSEITRPGRYFIRRLLNQLGMQPIQANRFASGSGARPIRSGPDFQADVDFWRLTVDGSLRSPTSCLSAPLIWSCPQPPTCTLWSDASGNAMGGWFRQVGSKEGVWWRYAFSPDVRARFRETAVEGNDELSINVLELLGMVVGAWVFVVQTATKPSHARDSIRMRGDNSSAVCWVNKCRAGRRVARGSPHADSWLLRDGWRVAL